jgi:exopolysaccharide production protein ExoQ
MMFGVFFLWMLLCVYRERDDPSRRRRLLAYGTITAMIVSLLYQCKSMTSITGLISAGSLMWLASRSSRRPAIVHLSVLVVISLAVTALHFDSSGGMVRALGRDRTLTGRTDTWNLVLSLHTNPWIGTGFESFWLGPRLEFMRSALENFPINEAHNGYVEAYLNLGSAGICFIALLLITGYKRITSGIRQNPERSSLFLGFFLCALFYSFSEAGFRPLTVSWFFLLLVIINASHARPLPRSLRRGRPARTGRLAAVEQTEYQAMSRV